MKYIIIILLLGICQVNIAQENNTDFEKKLQELNFKIKSLQLENSNLKSDIQLLNERIDLIENKADSLKGDILENSNELNKTSHELDRKIVSTENQTNQKLTKVDESIGQRTLYIIIVILIILLLTIIVYLWLSKKQNIVKADMIQQLSLTKSSIEENLIKEFEKQTNLMESQLSKIQLQNSKLDSNSEPDHALALKLASEITLIERNISLMEPGTKGLKQLTRSVSKLKDNLSANGYEIPDLLGKEFHQGMKLIVVNSIPDENMEKGSEIITKIIIPQVNYNDKMIQSAQIEVSVGV